MLGGRLRELQTAVRRTVSGPHSDVVVDVVIAEYPFQRLSLADALRSSMDDFDGSFSYLAADGECLAYVKDRYGFKPLVVAETDDWVAIATEEVALRQALGDGFRAREPAPGTMQVWAVAAAGGVLA